MRSDGLWRDSDAASAASAASAATRVPHSPAPQTPLIRYLPHASPTACGMQAQEGISVRCSEGGANGHRGLAGSSRISGLPRWQPPHTPPARSTLHSPPTLQAPTRHAPGDNGASSIKPRALVLPVTSQPTATIDQVTPSDAVVPSATRPGQTVCCSMDPCTEAHGPASPLLACCRVPCRCWQVVVLACAKSTRAPRPTERGTGPAGGWSVDEGSGLMVRVSECVSLKPAASGHPSHAPKRPTRSKEPQIHRSTQNQRQQGGVRSPSCRLGAVVTHGDHRDAKQGVLSSLCANTCLYY